MKQITLLLFLLFLLSSTAIGEEKLHNNYSIFGLLQCIYKYSSESSKTNHNFYLGKNGLGIKGKINKYIGYKVIIYADKNYRIAPFDIYGILHIPSGEIRIGQFKQPFSMERLIPMTKRDFANNSVATGLVQSRDFGVGLFGNFRYAEYNLSVINGTGLNKPEENSRKDCIGRVAFKPISGLKLGGAFYLGKSGPDSNLVKKSRYNLQSEYKSGKIHLMGEYVRTEDGDIKGWDYYLMGGYRFNFQNKYLPELETVLRYEKFDPDKDTPGNRQKLLTAGLNLYFDEYKFRVQLNYIRKMSEGRKYTNEILFAMQFMF